jgi:hypothetical protein
MTSIQLVVNITGTGEYDWFVQGRRYGFIRKLAESIIISFFANPDVDTERYFFFFDMGDAFSRT